VNFYRFGQFLFARQWAELREHARDRGVRVIGDLPIYVAADSADVWAHPDLFTLDADRQFGINDIQMPCTPERVWTALQGAGSGAATVEDAMPHFEAEEGQQ